MDQSLPPRKSYLNSPYLQSSRKAPKQDRITQELEHVLKTQQDLILLFEDKLRLLAKEKLELKDSIKGINEDVEAKTRENQELDFMRVKKMTELSQQLMEVKSLNAESECRKQMLESDLGILENEHSELIMRKNAVIRQRENQEQVLDTLNTKLKSSNSQLNELIEKENLFDIISMSYQESIISYNKKREDSYLEIKKLNNTLQELKGNIRVFCKIRPVLPEDNHKTMSRIDTTERSITVYKQDKPCKFFFDRVFPPTATNSDVFEEISQLVQSALDGYKVCIFAYGQTGSGKTYTMEGPNTGTAPQSIKGIIQKSVELMFESQKKLTELGWNFYFKASAIEIYMEQIRDLFDGSKVLTGFSTSMMTPHTVPIYSYEELAPLLYRARKSRAEAETESNAHSSRSHFLFKVEIRGEKDDSEVFGVLNMIDLAGSERLKKSKVCGERLKETKAINKSLSALGTVIQALVKKDNYVPYRNTKLTSILQNCLGGDGKTLMFVNVSPLEVNFKETLNSLDFAQKVNACTLEL